MAKYSPAEIKSMLKSGRYVGRGTDLKFDRMSLGTEVCVNMHELTLSENQLQKYDIIGQNLYQ